MLGNGKTFFLFFPYTSSASYKPRVGCYLIKETKRKDPTGVILDLHHAGAIVGSAVAGE
jgi:hypothetical protein